MATESVTPDQSIIEQVEKKVNEEVKAVEQVVSPSKGNGGENVEAKPETEELAISEAVVTDLEEKKEEKPVDTPAVVLVKKVDDVPVLDVQNLDVQKVIEECNPEPDVSVVPAPATEVDEKEPEEESKLPDTPVVVEEVKQSETTEAEDVSNSNSATEVIEKTFEAVDKLKEVNPTSEPDSKIVEKSESIDEKSELVEPKEIVEGEMAKDEVKAQEEVICKDQEHVAPENLDTVIAVNQEAPADPKDLRKVDVVPDVLKTADFVVGKVEEVHESEVTKTEIVSDMVEELATEASLDAVKVQKQEVKSEENIEEKNVKAEEMKQPEATKIEDASISNSTTDITEKSFEVETMSRDVEVVTEDKKEECVKDDLVTSVETSKNKNVREKPDLDEKAKETVETGADKLDKEAEVSEESRGDTKTGDLPKQEVPPKAQKHSKNIMSKVKQSIVKVKKAIIGKSPSSKTISVDAKDDLKAK